MHRRRPPPPKPLSPKSLDRLAVRIARPSDRLALQRERLLDLGHRLRAGCCKNIELKSQYQIAAEAVFLHKYRLHLSRLEQTLDRHEALLRSVDPRQVLQRGYAWLADESGHAITRVGQVTPGQLVVASLADGEVDLTAR